MDKKLTIAAVLLAFLGSVIFFNGPSNAESPRGKGIGGQSVLWKLDLTKEQKESITAKENSIEKEVLSLQNSIRRNRDLLDTELSADKPDLSKVNSLIDNISADMAGIQKKRVFFMVWMREQLTQEQKQKLLLLTKDGQGPEAGSKEPGK